MRNYFYVALIMTGVFLVRIGITPLAGKLSPFLLFLGATVIISRKFFKGPMYFGIFLGAIFGGYFSYSWSEQNITNVVSTSLVYILVSIIFAVYEQKSFENLLKKNEELKIAHEELDFILSSSGIGIYRQDLETHKIVWSETYKRLRGYEGREMPGEAETWVHPHDREQIIKAFKNAVIYKKDFSTDFRLLHRDGHYFWVTASMKVIFDSKGSPRQVIGTVQSIDDRVKVKERLEDEVEKRTAELKSTQAALIQSSRLSALGEMAGGVAHEMNSPLSVLRLKSEQVMRKIHLYFTGKREVTESELISDMKKNVDTIDRLSSIIKGLRYFSREGVEDVASTINLRDLIFQVLQFVQAKYNYDGIDLQIDTGLDDLTIICRKAELEQVLLSLMQNSYDAILNEPKKWIRIEAEQQNEQVIVRVIDSGKKIQQDVVEKMWQPFFTTKEVGSGMGLGLSVAKGIIEKHGGTLVYDEHASSTTFKITLPVKCLG